MTPSTTFQCPLSPAGTLQPSKFSPLKRETNPLGAVLSAAQAGRPNHNPTKESKAARCVTMMCLRLVQRSQDSREAPLEDCSTAAGFVPGATLSEPRDNARDNPGACGRNGVGIRG